MPHSHGSGGCSGGCDHNAAGQLGEEFGVQYRYSKIVCLIAGFDSKCLTANVIM